MTIACVDALPSREELLARRREQKAELDRALRSKADLERARGEMRGAYGALLADFVARARELEIAPVRIDPRATGLSVGSVIWAEGWRTTSVGVVSVSPLRYGVMKKRAIRRGLTEEVRQVGELSIFPIQHLSDHAPDAETMAGPIPANRVHDFDWRGPDDGARRLQELRDGLEADLLTLMP